MPALVTESRYRTETVKKAFVADSRHTSATAVLVALSSDYLLLITITAQLAFVSIDQVLKIILKTHGIHRIDQNHKEIDFILPHNMWNCVEAVLRSLLKSNNTIEGWHEDFEKEILKLAVISMKKPPINSR